MSANVPSSRQRRKQLQNVMGRIDPVRSSSVLLRMVKIVSRLIIVIALASSSRSFAVEQSSVGQSL